MIQANTRLKRILPVLGFGTWELHDRGCSDAVESAIHIGYRHIDTAQLYNNEKEVGKGIQQSGVNRSDLFVTTKIATDNLHPSRIISSTINSLRKLDMDYIDLLLIHWPIPRMDLKACLEAMFELQAKEYIKYVGVSNFSPELFLEALKFGPVLNNQVKFSPYHQQSENLEIARAKNKTITAYSPLGRGEAAGDQLLSRIGSKYNKTAAQTALRWLIQLGTVSVIPKAASEEHRIENFNIFNFELSKEDMQEISELDKNIL
jgi:2,5-diketo-D-gluconate reductase B